jgi:hypothetical protein
MELHAVVSCPIEVECKLCEDNCSRIKLFIDMYNENVRLQTEVDNLKQQKADLYIDIHRLESEKEQLKRMLYKRI